MLRATMRQVWIPRIGPPRVLEVREASDPEPAAGEVRVRAAASGINFADIMARMGLYPDAPKLPAVVGYEVSGTVDAVGDGVEGVSVGEKVVALTRFKGYGDVVCVPALQVAAMPDGLAFDTEGNLYISCYRPDRIYRLTLDGQLDILADDFEGTAIAAPTNVAFCGHQRDLLLSANLGRWHLTLYDLGKTGMPLNYPDVD